MSITNFNALWANYVRSGIADRSLNRRKLARMIGVDESNPSLWCRGHVPKRETVERIGEILNCPIQACKAAGYIHPSMRLDFEGLSTKSRQLLKTLQNLSPREQDRLTYSLRLALGAAEAVAG